MAKIVGIGGVFFKAADLPAARDWYSRVLGLELPPGGAMFPPLPYGVTVLGAFKATTGYFAPSTAPVMINLMVDDMAGVLARVQAAGVPVLKQEDSTFGRFAHIMDPTGLKLELWEPSAAAKAKGRG